jgi:hypothetical protein
MPGGLQTIIDKASSLTIDRRRVVGVQYSRSEIAKVSETPTRQPWRFGLNISAALQYGDNRDLMEALDFYDKRYPQVVSFSNVPGQSYIFAYQGAASSFISGMSVASFVGNQLTLNLPAIQPNFPAGMTLFKSGDILQIVGFPYPFTVVGPAIASNVITPGDVLRGSGTTITLTTHRPNIITSTVVGAGIVVGNSVQFNVFCPNMPTYRLVPGGKNALIEFSSDFQLYEWVGNS